jgi:hypothetical protein
MLGRAAMIAGLLLCAAAPAYGSPPMQDRPEDRSIGFSAANLAFIACLPYLAGNLKIADDPTLARFGLKGPVIPQDDPDFGPIELVVAKRKDGELSFGGAPGRLCRVSVRGADTAKVLETLRGNLYDVPTRLEPNPEFSSDNSNAKMEAYKGSLGDMKINFILEEARSPATAIVHVFLTEK